jgi:hypothetical protein
LITIICKCKLCGNEFESAFTKYNILEVKEKENNGLLNLWHHCLDGREGIGELIGYLKSN